MISRNIFQWDWTFRVSLLTQHYYYCTAVWKLGTIVLVRDIGITAIQKHSLHWNGLLQDSNLQTLHSCKNLFVPFWVDISNDLCSPKCLFLRQICETCANLRQVGQNLNSLKCVLLYGLLVNCFHGKKIQSLRKNYMRVNFEEYYTVSLEVLQDKIVKSTIL